MSTTKDPVRLLSDPGFPEAQRTLLLQGMVIEPPRGAEDAVWQALAGAAGAAAVSQGPTPTSAEAAGLTAAKVVAVVLALGALAGVVALGNHLLDRSSAPAPRVVPTTTPAAQAPAATTPPPAKPGATEPAGTRSPWDHKPAQPSTTPHPGRAKPPARKTARTHRQATDDEEPSVLRERGR
jgi:hypothetical protein